MNTYLYSQFAVISSKWNPNSYRFLAWTLKIGRRYSEIIYSTEYFCVGDDGGQTCLPLYGIEIILCVCIYALFIKVEVDIYGNCQANFSALVLSILLRYHPEVSRFKKQKEILVVVLSLCPIPMLSQLLSEPVVHSSQKSDHMARFQFASVILAILILYEGVARVYNQQRKMTLVKEKNLWVKEVEDNDKLSICRGSPPGKRENCIPYSQILGPTPLNVLLLSMLGFVEIPKLKIQRFSFETLFNLFSVFNLHIYMLRALLVYFVLRHTIKIICFHIFAPAGTIFLFWTIPYVCFSLSVCY